MRIATIFGTRPEIIRLSEVIRRLDAVCEQTLVHTGQNYDPLLSDVFFSELALRPPDVLFDLKGSTTGDRIAEIIARVYRFLETSRPDRVLILGDTDSGLAAFAAARLGIPVFHMEAGNRCYDDRVPEEINRRVIDHSSRLLMPYTNRSKDNLVREGIDRSRIFVTGNPIREVLTVHESSIARSDIHARMGLESNGYVLVTVHRAENVDISDRLVGLFRAFDDVAERLAMPLIVSVHPRTADRLAQSGIRPGSARVKLVEPLGLFDFVRLEKEARLVLSDSGTVQEECCIFRVPNVTIRDVTERPETIECGSNILSGADPAAIRRCVDVAIGRPATWDPPSEYMRLDVANTVQAVMLGLRPGEISG